MGEESGDRSGRKEGNGLVAGVADSSAMPREASRAQERAPHDPLAEKHRSAYFDKNWRTVNYARLNDGRQPVPQGDERRSDLLRPDWRPPPCQTADPAKSYAAKFASFAGSPFHAEVERLPDNSRKPKGV